LYLQSNFIPKRHVIFYGALTIVLNDLWVFLHASKNSYIRNSHSLEEKEYIIVADELMYLARTE
jgi:hypothetical protein